MGDLRAGRRHRADRGATTAEYLGVVVVVAGLIAVLAGAGLGARVTGGVNAQICRIVGLGSCAGPTGGSDTGAQQYSAPGGSAPATDPSAPFCTGFWGCAVKQTGSFVGNVFQGLGSDVVGIVDLGKDLVTDPGKVASGLWTAITHPGDTIGEILWSGEVSQRWNSGDYGGALGREVWNIGSFFIPFGDVAAGVGRAGKITETAADAARIAKAVERVGELTTDAEKAADAARAAARTGDVATAEKQAAAARKAADDAKAKAREAGCPLAWAGSGGGRGTLVAAIPRQRTTVLHTGAECGKAADAEKAAADAEQAAKDAKDVAAVEQTLGDSHTYVDLTRGNSVRNIGTDATHTEVADTLTSQGWTSRTSKDGTVQIFEKDGAKYVLRAKNSSGYPGWTADFTPAGSRSHTLELRLGYTP